jgi:hypothetical protein
MTSFAELVWSPTGRLNRERVVASDQRICQPLGLA